MTTALDRLTARAEDPPPAPEDLTRLLALANYGVNTDELQPRTEHTTIDGVRYPIHDTEPCPPPEQSVSEYLKLWFPPRPEGGL